MLGNPLIIFENGIAKARTDLQASHYYKDKENEKTRQTQKYHPDKERNSPKDANKNNETSYENTCTYLYVHI